MAMDTTAWDTAALDTTDTAAMDTTAWDTAALDTTVWDTAALDTTAWDASAMELDIVAMLLDTTSDSLPSQKKLYMPTNLLKKKIGRLLLLKRKLLKRKLLKRLKRLSSTDITPGEDHDAYNASF